MFYITSDLSKHLCYLCYWGPNLYSWLPPLSDRHAMVKLCFHFQHLSINVSIFTLVVIALDRYRGILWPLKGGYSKFRAKIHLMIVWFLATLLALPNLILYYVSQDPVSLRARLGPRLRPFASLGHFVWLHCQNLREAAAAGRDLMAFFKASTR